MPPHIGQAATYAASLDVHRPPKGMVELSDQRRLSRSNLSRKLFSVAKRCASVVKLPAVRRTGAILRVSVPFVGMHQLRMRVHEPALDDTQSLLHRQGSRKGAAPRAQAQEDQECHPRKSEAVRVVKPNAHGSQNCRMLIRGVVDIVEKRVEIKEIAGPTTTPAVLPQPRLHLLMLGASQRSS